MGPNAHQAQQIEQTQIDAAAKRRIHPGTKAADMAAGPPLIPLNEVSPGSYILSTAPSRFSNSVPFRSSTRPSSSKNTSQRCTTTTRAATRRP